MLMDSGWFVMFHFYTLRLVNVVSAQQIYGFSRNTRVLYGGLSPFYWPRCCEIIMYSHLSKSLFKIAEKLLFSALCSGQSERQDADMPFPPWGGGERCCL